jgi:hypothetical protein
MRFRIFDPDKFRGVRSQGQRAHFKRSVRPRLQILQAHLAVSFPEEFSVLRHSLNPEAGFDAYPPLFIPIFGFGEGKLSKSYGHLVL